MGMNASRYGLQRRMVGNRHLEQMPFSTDNSPMAGFLWPLSRQAIVYRNHFTSTILTADLTVSSDASCTDFVSTYGAGTHAAVGACDANDNQAISIIGANGLWCGDKNCGMLAIVKSSVVTTLNFEIGFIDAASDKTLPVVSDVDAPTIANGGGDLAVVHMDADQTLTTAAFVTEGSTASMVPTKTNLSTWAPTADTYFGVTVQLTGNAAQCQIFDPTLEGWPRLHYAAHGSAIASQVEGGVALKPWIFFRTRLAAVKTWSIDYLEVWQDM